jgi:TRAP-type C4-dicarboxylate transport system substrate-binding protein
LNSNDQAVITKAAFEAGNKHTELVTQRFTLDRSHIEQEGGQFQMLPPRTKNEFLQMVNQQVPRMEADGLIPLGWFDRIQTLQ